MQRIVRVQSLLLVATVVGATAGSVRDADGHQEVVGIATAPAAAYRAVIDGWSALRGDTLCLSVALAGAVEGDPDDTVLGAPVLVPVRHTRTLLTRSRCAALARPGAPPLPLLRVTQLESQPSGTVWAHVDVVDGGTTRLRCILPRRRAAFGPGPCSRAP